MLDDFAGLAPQRAELGSLWRARSEARRALEKAEAALASMKEEEDFLRHAVAELDRLDPQQGEEAELDARRRLMQSAERMREDVARVVASLGLEGAEGAMGNATRWIEGLTDKAEGGLDEALAAIERAMVELTGAQSQVERFADSLSFNPHELEETEERLFAIRALARKHDVLADDLGSFANDLRARLEALDGGAGQLDALQLALSTADTAYQTAAQALSAARSAAAKALDAAMSDELAPLKMERARFMTEITEAAAGADGIDTVTFTVATNPGAPAGALNKIASGGELSRFLLALKVCLTKEAAGLTMIFDEIDRGVGGATADAVGRRLAALADGEQVLVVTHSPQVAALGAHHWRVAKDVSGGVTTSRVTALDAAERVDEVARMLAGDTITDAARDAARALLHPQ